MISIETMQEAAELLSFVQLNGYLHPRIIHTGRLACVMPLLYTGAIITLDITNQKYKMYYEDRWCYHSIEAAKKALDEWKEGPEPAGWHRHPSTGRRREEGDPLKEYIHA